MKTKSGLKAENIVPFPGMRPIDGYIWCAGRKYTDSQSVVKWMHSLPEKQYRRMDKWIVTQYHRKVGREQGSAGGSAA